MKLDPNRNPLYVVGFAVLVSALFTAGIMSLHVATEPTVRANELLLEQRALVELFKLGEPGEMTPQQIASLVARRIVPAELNPGTPLQMQMLVATTYDVEPGAPVDVFDRQRVVGYAFPISGPGFWAIISGWIAFDSDMRTVLGVVFLRHAETPGLGGRITERQFRQQFIGLDLAEPVNGQFVFVERRMPDEPARQERFVQAITGATGTSVSVGEMLNADLQRIRQSADAAGLHPLEAPDEQAAAAEEGQPR